MEETTILCIANSYEKKYYLDPSFASLPKQVKEELQIMCVLYTEDVGGILKLEFDTDGSLYMEPYAEEEDLLYDEVGSVLKVKQLQREKQEFLEALELYYQVIVKKGCMHNPD